ncbi:hypothetical protein [Streptomyces kanamyceticus]|uniref:Uncharacterized protein n=1 Tax=Streptomyces kanamyceticus TaxID=1967 RepID=A0A5J6G7C9_STRKN|nr:hypothetical protein [Streptomyces kanamyceticus]QEU90883.1 hypothetical protein CP970_08260 [Streptomyces kanamyceticus]
MLTRVKTASGIAAVGLALGLTGALAGTAQATTGPESRAAIAVSDPGTTYQSGGWCHYSNWGGNFYCNSQLKHKLPNGQWQVFVIGTNRQAYSKWGSGSGTSAWTSLGGQCTQPGNHSIDMAWVNGWNFAITCKGTNGKTYYDERFNGGNTGGAPGHWSGWRLNKY